MSSDFPSLSYDLWPDSGAIPQTRTGRPPGGGGDTRRVLRTRTQRGATVTDGIIDYEYTTYAVFRENRPAASRTDDVMKTAIRKRNPSIRIRRSPPIIVRQSPEQTASSVCSKYSPVRAKFVTPVDSLRPLKRTDIRLKMF